MKYRSLPLILSVSGLLLNSFAASPTKGFEPLQLTPTLAGIDCPEDKSKPCIDDEIRQSLVF